MKIFKFVLFPIVFLMATIGLISVILYGAFLMGWNLGKATLLATDEK